MPAKKKKPTSTTYTMGGACGLLRHHNPDESLGNSAGGALIFSTRDEWLKRRNSGTKFGASEAAGCLNESEWASQFSIYQQKLGKAPPVVQTDKMTAGILGEPAAANIFGAIWAKPKGIDVMKPIYLEMGMMHEGRGDVTSIGHGPTNYDEAVVMYEAKAYPFMAATPDYFTREADGSLGLLEIKCPGHQQRHKWVNEPPLEYLIQLYHQYIVCKESHPNLKTLRLVAWFGSDDIIVWEFEEPDEDMIAWILRDEKLLAARIESGNPPPIDGKRNTLDVLKYQHPVGSPGSSIELPETMAARYFTARTNREFAEKAEKEAAADIMQAMGDNEIGLVNGDKLWQWKNKSVTYQGKPATETRTVERREFSAVRGWKKVWNPSK